MLMCNLAIRGVNITRSQEVTGRDGNKHMRNTNPAAYIDLIYDAANLKITNVDEVNQFVKRDYRDPWKLSGI